MILSRRSQRNPSTSNGTVSKTSLCATLGSSISVCVQHTLQWIYTRKSFPCLLSDSRVDNSFFFLSVVSSCLMRCVLSFCPRQPLLLLHLAVEARHGPSRRSTLPTEQLLGGSPPQQQPPSLARCRRRARESLGCQRKTRAGGWAPIAASHATASQSAQLRPPGIRLVEQAPTRSVLERTAGCSECWQHSSARLRLTFPGLTK